MGIKEYFIYDRRRQALHGYRLSAPGSHHYTKMRPRFGRLGSTRAEQADERTQLILAMQRETVLDILVARGLGPDQAIGEKVRACTDSAQLRRWATRAATASTLAEALSA